MDNNVLPDASERGENPFIYNVPVRGSDFIGRREIIRNILKATVLGKTQSNVWITGEMQMGKTSLLRYIEANEKIDKKVKLYGVEGEFEAVFIYLNLQDISHPIHFYKRLRQSLESYFSVNIKISGFADSDFAVTLHNLFEKHYYIVFLLDEFDVFFERLLTEDKHKALSFLANINSPSGGTPPFLPGGTKMYGCVFTSRQTVEECFGKHEINWQGGSGFNVEAMELPFFSMEETAKLAEHYLKENSITFSKEDIEFCFQRTHGFPYDVQKMFAFIYEQKVAGVSDYLKAAQEHSDFYLTSVTLENILGFKSLSTQLLSEDGSPLMFSLLLGDNSAGKTSFLRCLALGLCDKISAAALLDDYQGKFVHNGCDEGTITIDLKLAKDNGYRIVTRIKRIKHLEDVEKTYYFLPDNGKEEGMEPKDFPWSDLFVCGYGAGRVLGETRETYEEYRVKNAVGTLFRYDQHLQDPELSLRRVVSQARYVGPEYIIFEREEELLRNILFLIKNLFMFTGDERIELTGKGIEVVTAEGRSLLRAHGDGYKNTSGWVLDFIAWNMLAERSLSPPSISGIVMLDEIEQHLHPKWQRNIVQLLCKLFPRVQFIVATHSPLCTSGIADLDENMYQVFRFHKTGNEPASMVPVPSLCGLRADQILTSEAFDLPTTRNPKIAEKLERFSKLYLKEPRTKWEEDEFHELGRELEERIPSHIDFLETHLRHERVKSIINTTQKKQTKLK